MKPIKCNVNAVIFDDTMARKIDNVIQTILLAAKGLNLVPVATVTVAADKNKQKIYGHILIVKTYEELCTAHIFMKDEIWPKNMIDNEITKAFLNSDVEA